MSETYTPEQIQAAINAGARAAFDLWYTGKTKQGQSFSKVVEKTFRLDPATSVKVPWLNDNGSLVPVSVSCAGNRAINGVPAPLYDAQRLLRYGFDAKDLDPTILPHELIELTAQRGMGIYLYCDTGIKCEVIDRFKRSLAEHSAVLDDPIEERKRAMSVASWVGAAKSLGIDMKEIGLSDARQVG